MFGKRTGVTVAERKPPYSDSEVIRDRTSENSEDSARELGLDLFGDGRDELEGKVRVDSGVVEVEHHDEARGRTARGRRRRR